MFSSNKWHWAHKDIRTREEIKKTLTPWQSLSISPLIPPKKEQEDWISGMIWCRQEAIHSRYMFSLCVGYSRGTSMWKKPLERALLPVKQGVPLWTILMCEWYMRLMGRRGEGRDYYVLWYLCVHLGKHVSMAVIPASTVPCLYL